MMKKYEECFAIKYIVFKINMQTFLYGSMLFDKKALILNTSVEFYSLNDSKNLLFSNFSLESLGPFRNFLDVLSIFTPYFIFLDFFVLL